MYRILRKIREYLLHIAVNCREDDVALQLTRSAADQVVMGLGADLKNIFKKI